MGSWNESVLLAMDTASHIICLMLLTEQKLAGQQATPAPRKKKIIIHFYAIKY